MHKIINITLKAIAAVLMLAAAASCVFEKENPSGNGQQKYKYVLVQLGVSTDRMTATKAQGDTVRLPDSVGIAAETAIKDLRVYAYTNEKKNGVTTKRLCGYLYAEDVDAAETSGSPLLMDIKVPFEEYKNEQTVYFAAIANSSAMKVPQGVIIDALGRNPDGSLVPPANFAWSSFGNITYKIDQEEFPETGMPMYFQTDENKDAVTEYDPNDSADDDAPVKINLMATGTPVNQPGHNGHTKLPVTVNLDMTRSLAKIEVYAAEDAGEGTSGASNAEIQITGVELMNVIAEGPLFPATASTTTLSPAPAMTVSTAAITAGVADEDKTDASKYTQATSAYYLAENAAGDSGKFYYGDDLTAIATTDNLKAATTLKIGYKVGNSEKTGYVIMPPIERNTWYKVLARIKANGQITLTLIVKDWKDIVKEEINFEDHVSLSQNITWSGDVNQATEEGKTTLTFKSTTIGQTATCSFGMDAPKGGTWYVTLTGGNINGFELETTVGEKLIKGTSVSGPINPEQTVEVKVKTLTSTNLKEELRANLQIVAKSVDGRTLAVMDGSRNASFIIVQPSTNN